MGRAHEVRAASMAKTAAIKSKQNAKHAKMIYLAAKSGVADPELNQALKKEIEKAKKANVPNDVIKRQIEKAKGGLTGGYTFARYEGFGPGNSMVMVDCLTDNVNRTYTSVKVAFAKSGFKLGVAGCCEYLFKRVSFFEFKNYSEEEVLEVLMASECEVLDIEVVDDHLYVYGENADYAKIKQALLGAFPEIEFETDETTWICDNDVELDDEDYAKFEKFEEMLSEIEDVQDYYHNIK